MRNFLLDAFLSLYCGLGRLKRVFHQLPICFRLLTFLFGGMASQDSKRARLHLMRADLFFQINLLNFRRLN